MNELYWILQTQVSFEAKGIRGFPNSTFVPFPFLDRQAMLMLNSFSGEEPVRAIRPMTQTGSGTFCFRSEAFRKDGRPRKIFLRSLQLHAFHWLVDPSAI